MYLRLSVVLYALHFYIPPPGRNHLPILDITKYCFVIEYLPTNIHNTIRKSTEKCKKLIKTS